MQLGGPTTYFGWIRVTISPNINQLVIHDYAYTTTPVELAHFNATTQDQNALLNWTTASETNNAGFEIQHRQLDHTAAWETVGFVEGQGTTSEETNYSYRLSDLSPGRHVFRLKQVDFDGAFEYSPEVEVAIAVPGTHVLSAAYPNPFNPQAQFTLAVAAEQEVRVEVYNAQGQRVSVLHEGVLAAQQQQRFTFDGSSWPSGVYLIRVTGATFSESKQVTLLK